jgi:predicted nucleic acid-binding protein
MPNGRMKCFVDTNVFLHAQDPHWPEKQKRTLAWLDAVLDKNLAVISPQVMNEFAYTCLKRFRDISIDQILGLLQGMETFCRVSTTADTAINGLLLRQRFGLSFYDAVLIASAISADCGIFLSEDLQHFQSFGSLTVANPFRVAPQDLL